MLSPKDAQVVDRPTRERLALRIFAAVLCLLVTGDIWAQDTFEPPASGFEAGWERSEQLLTFIGHDLYAHINGGAELYHEFGFDRLHVQYYRKADQELALEVYLMSDPNAALGLYLMKAAQESPVDGIRERTSGDASQIVVVKGSAFVRINNYTFTDSLLPTMVNLANTVTENLPDEPAPALLSRLPRRGLQHGTERFIRGPYALAQEANLGQGDILHLAGRIWGVLGRYTDQHDSTFTLIEVRYPDPERAGAAFSHLMQNLDELETIIEKERLSFTFRDHRGRFGEVTVRDTVMVLNLDMYSRDSHPAASDADTTTASGPADTPER